MKGALIGPESTGKGLPDPALGRLCRGRDGSEWLNEIPDGQRGGLGLLGKDGHRHGVSAALRNSVAGDKQRRLDMG